MGVHARAERIALFLSVRYVPYATDGAPDRETLMVFGRGDCLAKSACLISGFRALGYQAGRVRRLDHLPDQPAEVWTLVSREEDDHTAAEVLLEGQWRPVDATHDPGLAAAGLVSARWDGLTDTAHEPKGPLWRPGDGPEPQPTAGVDEPDDAGGDLQGAFGRWLRAVRSDHAQAGPGGR
ncbi:hypothetical protein HCN51_56070 [Nonomuraea sp. FMUSA5-5]|uniref:Transglutaminase-like domain-containing protein n=1 Tax=Nonomuraea composti TaxID=2720023 RepID=A0ABX1BNM5_9ACTN|nr:transglutaminase domain-containing protein [Nonomuraea sp. FMUSA5-5]NJP98642.1 hypothetical protein [Nonomuraea sp. FMUSA5-5]